MKVKGDFVTNSSSTSYVFCFPKDFDIRGYITKKLGPEEVEEDENLSHSIDTIVNGNQLFEADSFSTYKDIIELLSDFEIAAVDVPSDQGEIQIMYLEDINKQIKEKVSEYENKK